MYFTIFLETFDFFRSLFRPHEDEPEESRASALEFFTPRQSARPLVRQVLQESATVCGL
jgi:hypothetical protein